MQSVFHVKEVIMHLRLHWAWLLPVLLLSSYLGLTLINYDALWFDEWITLFLTGTGKFESSHVEGTICESIVAGEVHSFAQTLCLSAIDNSWPPLYFGLQMAWDWATGGFVSMQQTCQAQSVAELCINQLVQARNFIDRCLALFFGLLAIATTYRLGRSLFNIKTGLIAAVLLGTSVFFTFYMHEIRGYTLYVFMAALNGLLYWYWLKHPQAGWGVRWGFALSITGTLYTHYIGIAVVFGIGLYHILFERPPMLWQQLRQPKEKRQESVNHWLQMLKLYINGGLVYSLWIGVLYISYVNSALLDRSIPLFDLLQGMLMGFSNNLSVLALIVLLVAAVHWKERPIRFLWVWGLCVLGVAMLGNIYADFLFHPRHIMGLMPAFMLLLAAGILRIPKFSGVLGWGILALWLGAGLFYSHSTSLMNSIPRHVDAVPLSAMNSIVETAAQCGTSDTSFVLGINTPDEEWVQDHIIGYYLGDFPMKSVSQSRIMDDELVKAQISPLLSDELETGTVLDRFEYFTNEARAVYLFSLPNQAIEAEIASFQNLLETSGFVACEPFINRPDLIGQVFVRDAEQCAAVCGGQ
jgi:hypothetical protein